MKHLELEFLYICFLSFTVEVKKQIPLRSDFHVQDRFREMFYDFSLSSHLKSILWQQRNGCRYWVPSRHIWAVHLKKTLLSSTARLLRGRRSPERWGNPRAWVRRGARLSGWWERVPPGGQPEQLTKASLSWRGGDRGGQKYLCVQNLVPSPAPPRCTPAGLGSNLAKVLLPRLSVIHNSLTFCEEHKGSRRGMSPSDPQTFQNPFHVC